MEHYRKKRVRFYEAEALPNEIKVNNSGRAPDIVSKAARKLKVAICMFSKLAELSTQWILLGGRV